MQGDPLPGSPESVSDVALQVLWLGDPLVLRKQGWLGALRPLQAGTQDPTPRYLCYTTGPSSVPSGPTGQLKQGKQLSCVPGSGTQCSEPPWEVVAEPAPVHLPGGTLGWEACPPVVSTPPLLLCDLTDSTTPGAFLPLLTHEMGPSFLGKCPEELKSAYHP